MIVLDTNVISELMKLRPAPRLFAWFKAERLDEIHTTAISEAEVLFGISILPPGKRRKSLLEAAESTFAANFAGRVLPFDPVAARTFADVAAHRRGVGRPISAADAQIAAITRAHGATLATRNSRDFADCGLRLVDPWQSQGG